MIAIIALLLALWIFGRALWLMYVAPPPPRRRPPAHRARRRPGRAAHRFADRHGRRDAAGAGASPSAITRTTR
jgi:hypothetical protein